MPSPYQPTGSQFGRFPFASRTSAAPAPLFYSATDEFREEDDGEEHEREVADFYALQRSRRHFGGSNLTDSSEADADASHGSPLGGSDDNGEGRRGQYTYQLGRGIRSSWKGERESTKTAPSDMKLVEERDESVAPSEASARSSKGKGRMVDVELASTVRDSFEHLQRNDIVGDAVLDMDDRPSGYRPLISPSSETTPRAPQPSTFLPRETDAETALKNPRPPSPDRESVPATVAEDTPEYPIHDPFWSSLYLICLASVFATYFLVYLHTSAPDRKHPIGDTIYSLLQSSGHLLAVYTVVSACVALLWLALLRYFVRPLAMLLVVAVPIILFSFSLYPHIASYSGAWHGDSVQDRAMRWLSFIPAISAAIWTYTVYRGRHSFGKALEILGFSGRVLAANAPLVYVGFADLATVIGWTWIWRAMFARVFLGGHLSKSKNLFIIDGSSWWLGVYFVLIYLWTLAIISGIQRATTAATVSNWYFHRLVVPAPSSQAVVQASIVHSTTTMFGTICLSTLLSLAIRLPLLILPRRLAALLSLAAYSLVPTPIATLTNPLSLTYAAIHSQPLNASARGMSHLSFVSPNSPTTMLSPKSFGSGNGMGPSLLPYRLAKLLLHATRFVMALALGFGGWVVTARQLEVVSAGVKGSLYAYVVGLLAAAIGWGVLGATEGILGGILDALVICWASEVGGKGYGEARYCREAGELFGERDNWAGA